MNRFKQKNSGCNWLMTSAIMILIFGIAGQADASTSVGNGGSHLRLFIKEARQKVAEVLEEVNKLPQGNESLNFICAESKNFTAEQIKFCQDFFAEVKDQMYELVTQRPAIPFDIVSETLSVKTPEGKTVIVDAITYDHDKDGKIFFNTERIKTYSPQQMLFLWLHELGHKVVYKHQTVEDFTAIGPFAEGNQLLDAIAESLANFALKNKIIANNFILMDRFYCEYRIDKKIFTDFTVSAQRYFRSSHFTYQSGFDSSSNPYSEINLYQPFTGERLYLSLEIYEDSGCEENDQSQRHAELHLKKHGISEPLDSVRIYKNPICDKLNDQGDTELSINYEAQQQGITAKLSFTCKYVDSFALSRILDLTTYLIKKFSGQ